MKEGTDNKGPDDKVVTFDPKRKRKLKELKPQKHRQPMTLKEALMSSLQQDDTDRARDFDECYARLLRVKARLASNFLESDDEKREALTDRLQDQESDALWGVIYAQGVHRWQIAHKLQLLDELMHIGSWVDRRDYFLLNSARLDLEHADWRAKGVKGQAPEREGA
jgi:hypothetical protein